MSRLRSKGGDAVADDDESEDLLPWHRWLLAAALARFVVFVVSGYLLPIGWSGFAENTFFDWVSLLFVPLLMPLLIVPATTGWVTAGIHDKDPEPVRYEIWLSPDHNLTAELLPSDGQDGGSDLVVNGAYQVVRVGPATSS